jgi:hypothetical protein
MKLSALPIILIGLAVGVVVLSYAYFHEFAPNMTQAQYNNEHADLLQQEANKMPQAKKRVETAEKLVREREDAWAQIVARRTLPSSLAAGGINLNQDDWHLANDTRKFRNIAQRDLNRQLKRGGVTVVNGPAVPFPDFEAPAVLANYFNYPAFPFPVVLYDLGQVTVRGTYQQISDHIRAWSTMPNYLAVTDGLQITGTAPQLTATYNLSVLGYLEVPGLFTPVPEGAGGGAPGTAGGGTAPAGGRRGGGRMGAG